MAEFKDMVEVTREEFFKILEKRGEKRALLIEDNERYRYELEHFGQGKFDTPPTLEEAENLLRTRLYSAVLLDGRLDQDYPVPFIRIPEERDTITGLVIGDRIREGFYGLLNKNTPLFSYSRGEWMKKFLSVEFIKGGFEGRYLEQNKKDLDQFIQTYLT